MNKIVLISLIVLFVMPLSVSAQNTYPGFQGKLNTIQGGLHVGTTFKRSILEFPTAIKYDIIEFVPNFQFDLLYTRSLSEKRSFVASISRSSTYVDMGGVDQIFSSKAKLDVKFVTQDGELLELETMKGFSVLNCTSVGLGIKRFRPEYGALAPIGGYYNFTLNTHFINANLGNIIAYPYKPPGHKYYAFYSNRKNILTNFQFGFGSSRVFAGRWVSDFGVNFGILNFKIAGSGMTEATDSEKKLIDLGIRKRMKWFHNTKFYYSIGFLF